MTMAALITVSYWIGMFAGYHVHEPAPKEPVIKEIINKSEKDKPLLKKDLTC